MRARGERALQRPRIAVRVSQLQYPALNALAPTGQPTSVGAEADVMRTIAVFFTPADLGAGNRIVQAEGIVTCYRGDELPAMPYWLTLTPPARMTAWRVALFAVLLVIVAVLGARDWLRRA